MRPGRNTAALLALALGLALSGRPCHAAGSSVEIASPAAEAGPGSFPEPGRVLQGRVFASRAERDVYFLRAIQARYPAHWIPLLRENVTAEGYVREPGKLLRFVELLGAAMAGTDDRATAASLAPVVSDPAFYANTNAYHPEILRAAAKALLELGPGGRRELAGSFSQDHYRKDPASLAELAGVIGGSNSTDPVLVGALVETALRLTATNGGFYPRCTATAIRNLLRLPGGSSALSTNLTAQAALDDPGRFQFVIEGIEGARAGELSPRLESLYQAASAKRAGLAKEPGPYRDDLDELIAHLLRTTGRRRFVPPAGKP
jgi:hypothetical protein